MAVNEHRFREELDYLRRYGKLMARVFRKKLRMSVSKKPSRTIHSLPIHGVISTDEKKPQLPYGVAVSFF